MPKLFFFPLYNRLLKNERKEMTTFRYLYTILLIDAIFMMIRTIVTKKEIIYWTINIPSNINKFFVAFLFIIIYAIIVSMFTIIPYAINKKANSKQEVINVDAKDEALIAKD